MAKVHADTLAIRGLPRVEVLTNQLSFPEFRLSGPPGCAGSTLISEILSALGSRILPGNDAPGALWMGLAGKNYRSARLSKDKPASFLMVSPGDNGQFDLNTGQLLSVWLDGHEVELK